MPADEGLGWTTGEDTILGAVTGEAGGDAGLDTTGAFFTGAGDEPEEEMREGAICVEGAGSSVGVLGMEVLRTGEE